MLGKGWNLWDSTAFETHFVLGSLAMGRGYENCEKHPQISGAPEFSSVEQ